MRTALERLRAYPRRIGHHCSRRADECQLCDWNGSSNRRFFERGSRRVSMQQCRTGLLRTLAIPVLRGREFCSVAVKGSQPVVIVNETFGRAVFGHMDPAGHTIKPDFPDAKEQLIVGVVKDREYFTLGEKQRLAAYEPYFIS